MITFTLQEAIDACGGHYHGPPALRKRAIRAIVHDSRKVTDGALFAAIRGERTDGHLYMAAAVKSGALAALCERLPEDESVPAILVESTERALREIAARYRGKFDGPLIGVTGSVGKTTTKEMLAAVLEGRFRVHRTAGNFNNELGVPLTLFGLEAAHEAAVVEMGISHFGEMRRLTQMTRPTMAVFTVIGHSHLEFLHDREGVLRAKTEMLEGMAADALVLVNGDDDLLRAADMAGRRVLRYGLREDCELRAEGVYTREDGMAMCFDVVMGTRRFPVCVPAYGEHIVYSALAAAGAGLSLGLTAAEVTAGLAAFVPAEHRSRIVRAGRCTLVDDCYNASPDSGRLAIRSLAALPGRKVCILGDMLELGGDAARLHAELGRFAAENGAQLIIACGPLARHIDEGASGAGTQVVTRYFDEKKQLIESLPHLLEPGDAVLVKASHGMHFEEIAAAVEALL